MAPGRCGGNFQCVNFKRFSGVDIWVFVEKFLQDYSAISFDSGNGLVPSGNKPPPEPILIKFVAKPWLPEPIFTYWWLNKIQWNLNLKKKIPNLSFMTINLKLLSAKWQPFWSDLNVLFTDSGSRNCSQIRRVFRKSGKPEEAGAALRNCKWYGTLVNSLRPSDVYMHQ